MHRRRRCTWGGLVGVLGVVAGMAVAPPAGAQPEPKETPQLLTADSVRIAAYWYDRVQHAEDAPVVILIHNAGYSHYGWDPLLSPLLANGFRVLSLDLRGHGASRDLNPAIYEAIRRRNTRVFPEMIHDVEAAIAWVRRTKKVPDERMALVGGEFGASLAVRAMARNPKLGAAVLLTPFRNTYSVALLDDLDAYGKRPLFVLTTKTYLFQGSQEIADRMKDNPKFTLKVFPQLELKGVDLLNLSWNLEKRIVTWLRGAFELDAS